MDQAGIIRDLLIWLEGHLDQPLSLDNVAAKAGYSKWHLQRMFKDVTGHAIGAYIRARRLSKSAVALRLTARPILDIALQYRFDSQQTFTRAFKKQFAQTPALYRRSPEWSAFGIRPPLRLGEFTMPEHKFVTLEDTPLIGVTQSYSCSLEQISDFRHEMRYQFWHDFLGKVSRKKKLDFGILLQVISIFFTIERQDWRTILPSAISIDITRPFYSSSHRSAIIIINSGKNRHEISFS